MSHPFEDHAVDLEQLDSTKSFGRRSFMIGALATGAAVAAPVNYAAIAKKRRVPFAKNGKFNLGVASGFPRPRGIVLWTELSEVTRTSKLRVAVAKDPKFRNTVFEKDVVAREDRGFTTSVFVRKLQPRTEYYYRFFTKNSKSEVGRFRTAPPLDSEETIKIAYFSCQNYEAGFFNAQQAIAETDDLDLVVCLGDYMYEYSDAKESAAGEGTIVRVDTTGRNADGDVQLLDEYRQKYRLYKADPQLRAMHARHPFISVWDDHEVEDNHADGSPSSAQTDPNKTNLKDLPRRTPYNQRRANGYQAFFNYMPRIRFKAELNRIYEDYRLGKNVDLFLTDERQYRAQQPCGDPILEACPDTDTPRNMLGDAQKNWLLRGLKNSPANWKIWGTQLMLMGLRLTEGVAAQVDSWDGYAYERKLIVDYLIDNNVPNVVAITGDIHTFFAGTVYTTGDDRGRPAFPEFVGGSATSTGIPEATGLSDQVLTGLAGGNKHISFYDFRRRGYGLVEATKDVLTCELRSVNAKVPGSAASTLAKFQVLPGTTTPQRII